MDQQSDQELGRVPIAELTSGELDAAQLQAWASELLTSAEELEVRLKGPGLQRAANTAVALADGLEALTTGAAVAMQVRYRYDDRRWADTLTPLAGGRTRVLRAALPDQP
jgi:hypothetical protein